jgi:ABC-2 type transport system permease protein
MSKILTIGRTEARRIFVSPLAWSVLAGLQLVLGMVFWFSLIDFANNSENYGDNYGVSDYIVAGTLVGFPTILMLLVMPVMTMRLFAEERKSGTITLLFGAPVSLVELVLGKFLGLLAFVGAVIGLLALMSFSLLPATGWTLDLGRIAAGLLGLFLMMSAFGAAGLFVSSLTKEPVIAAVTSLILLLAVWLIQIPSGIEGVPFPHVWEYLSLISHFDSLRRGVFDSGDVVYYVLFITLFLWMTVQRLDMERN